MTTRTRPIPRWRIGVGRAVVPAHRIRTALAAMLLLLAGLAVVGTLALPATKPPELVPALVYLVLIGLVTYVGGRRAGIIALVACAVAFDYLFVPPFHHLHPIGSGEGATAPDIETLVAFVVVGLAEVELRARARAETHRARLLGNQMIVLASVSERLSESFDYERTLDEVARLSALAFDGFCVIDLIDDDGTVRRVAAAGTDARRDVLAQGLRRYLPDLASADHPVGQVIRSGEAQVVPNASAAFLARVATNTEHAELIRKLGARSIIMAPLIAKGRTVGALVLATGSRGRYGDAELDVAEDLATRIALAVDNARLYQERNYIAQTLQRSLLPPHLPAIPGIALDARYHPLLGGGEVGGDFYDVFPIGPETWTLVIGDVCGKGPDAAAVMGVARYTLRAAAVYEARPSRVLRTTSDILLEQDTDQRFVTAACARLRRGEGRARLTIAVGGHPLPIVVRASGEAAFVGEPGMLLGVLPEPELTDVIVDLDPGDFIVFYTDGVLDERHSGAAGGEARLLALLARCSGSPVQVVADALDRFLLGSRSKLLRDDAAFLVVGVSAS